MLDFRRRKHRSSSPGWGSQRRVLALVGLSGLVLILTLQAGDPQNWKWIEWDRPGAAPEKVPGGKKIEPEPPVQPAAATGADARAIAGADVPPIEVDLPPPRKPPKPGDLYPGVRNDYLSLVRDDTVFLPDEADAWFHLFDALRHPDAEPLEPYSLGPVSYLQLDQQPGAYRGRAVSLRGTVRSAKLVEAPVNAFNVPRYYQLWLQPERSSPVLVVVYCLELPPGFPLGEHLDLPVSLTGIFYKRWTYASREGITTAPLVVAKSLSWTPAPIVAPVAEPSAARQVAIATGAALVLALLTLAIISKRTRVSSQRGVSPANPSLAVEGMALEHQPDVPVRETSS